LKKIEKKKMMSKSREEIKFSKLKRMKKKMKSKKIQKRENIFK
jgi:hypothetical protein